MRFLIPMTLAIEILATMGFPPTYNADTLTLPTGAKMFYDSRSGGWGIYGYSYDHSDIAPYLNMVPNDAPPAPF